MAVEMQPHGTQIDYGLAYPRFDTSINFDETGFRVLDNLFFTVFSWARGASLRNWLPRFDDDDDLACHMCCAQCLCCGFVASFYRREASPAATHS